MRAAVFLDRDGTINIDHGFTYRVSELEFIPGAIHGLKLLSQSFELFIVTNQSGIARGLFSENQLEAFHQKLVEDVAAHSINFKHIYVCPHHPDQNCECRKPKVQFLKEAERDYEISLKDSWVIGDRSSDIELALNAGCHSVFLFSGTLVQDLDKVRNARPFYYASDLEMAARFIVLEDDSKIIERKHLKAWSKHIKDMGKRLVTLNGTFDILHAGHEKMIREAKAQGDTVLIAINADSSVKKNKGPDRPFNSEQARARMLSTYAEIGAVTIFEEQTPIEILEDIRPHVHVNGSDYGRDCIEAPTVEKYGGRIHIVDLVPGLSSTKLIHGKLKKN